MKEKIKDTLTTVAGSLIITLILFSVPNLSSDEDACWYTEGIPCEESL